ncbi:MAG: amidohydrolase [Puniceicoccaceae bacterium]|nr:amidohydrolase [Puniceicoccaceae bacterium]
MSTPSIIDCHTHCFSTVIRNNPRSWAIDNDEPHWCKLVAPKTKPSIQGWASADDQILAMDKAGVEQSVLLGWYWEQEKSCRCQNDVTASWVKKYPERFIGYAAIQPNTSSAAVIDQLEYANSLGLNGVGELHMGVQGFNSNHTGWNTLADWCCSHHWPINLHVTEAVGSRQTVSSPTPLSEFIAFAEGHPKLCMILAHWGGGLAFFEQNPRIRKILKNVYYDCAASPLLYDASIFRNIIESVGLHKILFGSDYPLRVYPKLQKAPTMTDFIECIQSNAQLTDTELASIFYKNFKDLTISQ